MARRRQSDYIDFLSRVPLFSQCTKTELKALARRTNDIRAEAGQVLVKEGQGSYDFFVVVDGRAKVTRNGRKVAEIGPGSFFGELGLLNRALRDATVTATTAMEIIVLPQWEFEQALTEAPRMTRNLMAGMARRLRELDKRS
ncbi:MAG TPA: cyclic nucleotide-binding domain-containing protein [Acidimicrobiia bacterium]|nr:cyclic nucleotide-binding domain-containing protein [Acidimicrobiia bacterium]